MATLATPHFHLCDSHGVLLRRDAVRAGVNDNALARLVRTKVLIRLRHGAYCQRDVFLAADARERHRLLARAVMQQYGDHVVLSHASSCIAQGGPDYGLDLRDVHITHLSGGGRQRSRVRHHRGECRVGDLRRQDAHWLTTPARAVLEAACCDGPEAALVQANHFLYTGGTTLDELRQVYTSEERWPGSLVHHPVLLLADPRIESVGETRSDYLFWTQGLPRPVPQYEVFDLLGTLIGRADFAWPERRVLLEFDGLTKYHRFRRPGESIEAMVIREKQREDRLRELGWTIIRITWADLATPERTAARIRSALSVAA